MNLLQAIILGVIQGLTEYLPISSTAHLRILPEFLGWSDPGAAFTAVIQLGTLLAVFVYFRSDLARLARGSLGDLRSGDYRGRDLRLTVAILAGTIPIGVCGILFKDLIENELRGMAIIAGSLIFFALLLALAEKLGRRNRATTDLTFWDVQIIGAAQALALIPGASRSGTTIMAALFIGMRRDEGARFSFLLGIPAIAAAGVFEFKDLVEAGLDRSELAALAVGTVAAFVSGILAIKFLISYLARHSTMVFIVYRLALGAAILVFLRSFRG